MDWDFLKTQISKTRKTIKGYPSINLNTLLKYLNLDLMQTNYDYSSFKTNKTASN